MTYQHQLEVTDRAAVSGDQGWFAIRQGLADAVQSVVKQ